MEGATCDESEAVLEFAFCLLEIDVIRKGVVMLSKTRVLWAVLALVCTSTIVGCGKPAGTATKTTPNLPPNTTDSK